MFSLALVTGSSSGIGKSLCYLLANQGIHLMIHGRDLEKLENLAQDLRKLVNVSVIQADLTDSQQRKKLVDCIQQNKPDLVINNAGQGLYGEALSFETSESLDLFTLNATTVLELSLEAARTMISNKKRGVIVNISSAAAFPIFPFFAVYSASKAFVNQFSESFDEETKPYGVRVLVTCPGVVATQFRKRAGARQKLSLSDAMSPDYAAQKIWQQILKGKKLQIINWRYRLTIFFVQYLIPKSIISYFVKKEIAGYLHPK